MKQKLILIDGNSLLHRAFHAIPPLHTPSGELVNAVFGFSNMLTNIIRDLQPQYITIAFDTSKKTFRHEIFQDYKATRQKAPQELYDQIPRIKEVIEAFHIPIYECDGFEADDVLGTLARQGSNRDDLHTLIVTGDLDALQLVNDRVSVMTPLNGFSKMKEYNAEEVKGKYGVLPDQVVDYKALKGDASDNIPGVFGIGEKGAQKIISQYGSLENVYEHAHEIGGTLGEKLLQGRETAFLSRTLARIQDNVPVELHLDKADIRHFQMKAIRPLFEQLHFTSLLARLQALAKKTVSSKQASLF